MVAKSMRAVLQAQVEAIRFTAAATQEDSAAAYAQLGGQGGANANIMAIAQAQIDNLQSELSEFTEEPTRKRARLAGEGPDGNDDGSTPAATAAAAPADAGGAQGETQESS